MRPHGRASISQDKPRALAICQRCGFMYNRDNLQWQYQYGGMGLINLRILVCESCRDTPQIQLRTVLLPPDPVPISFPVPEVYTATDNPISGIGFQPVDLYVTSASTYGVNFGTINGNAGVDSVFDANIRKQSWRSATTSVSNSSYQNTIGKNWNGSLNAPGIPSDIIPDTVTYSVTSFSIYAPIDLPILSGGATGVLLQGSNDGAVWTTLYSTTTTGTNGEQLTSVSSNMTTGNYQYHRVVIEGDGTSQISLSQVEFNVATTGNNEQ